MKKITAFDLHDYQREAAEEIAKRYLTYRKSKVNNPFLQFLVSATGSGKTAMLAQTVGNILNFYSIQPLILWLSCNKVIVQQTLRNLQGKYQALILSSLVKSFEEISPADITQIDTPIIYVDTVQKFNVQERDSRQIYQVKEDKGNQSAWDLIRERKDHSSSQRRDLIILYDEGHNLTDRQVKKILELDPRAIILASGTPSLPHDLKIVQEELTKKAITPLYQVPFREVKEKQMVKSKIVLGGYKTQKEEVINEMLDKDWKELCLAAEKENLPTPKIIYVCKTNLLEVKNKRREKDNPQVPFSQRQAPPILIWRHLVYRGIDPKTIAVYADIEVAKEERYALDVEFQKNLFSKGKSSPKENTYEKFVASDFQHIIFNKSLAEGWDDPMVYLAYIDKTIGSEIAVEQIIGRVLRQPNCHYYSEEALNKAYFHIRVDENKVFEKIIEELNEKLNIGGDIIIRDAPGGVGYLMDIPAKEKRKVPLLTWDSEYIQRKLQKIVNEIPDYEDYPLVYRQNIGTRRKSEYELGLQLIQPSIIEEAFGLANMVPAQVILRRTIISRNTKVWNMLQWEDSKFKTLIGWGSKADEKLQNYGKELVETYLKESLLKISLEEPYQVKGIKIKRDERKWLLFKNALHEKYTDLNGLEQRTAYALDSLEIDWCRNPNYWGYNIELIDEGKTQHFFPDFLLWPNQETVVCLEVTGEHLERDKLKRKLVRISQSSEEMLEEMPQKVYVIVIVEYGNPKEGEERYYKVWYRKRKSEEPESIKVEDINQALDVVLSDLV